MGARVSLFLDSDDRITSGVDMSTGGAWGWVTFDGCTIQSHDAKKLRELGTLLLEAADKVAGR